MRVVVGHRMGDLIPMIERANASVVMNPDYPTGMFSSVQAGLKSIPRKSEAFFVHPVDIPMIYPSTISEMIDRYNAHEGMIIYPCYRGNRGHPPLVPGKFSKAITRANISGKLNDVLASFKRDSIDLEVEDPNILLGINHPDDYTAMVSGLTHGNILTHEQT